MIIVTLLIVAIIFSTASVLMNLSIMNGVTVRNASSAPQSGEISLNILETSENTGGNINGFG